MSSLHDGRRTPPLDAQCRIVGENAVKACLSADKCLDNPTAYYDFTDIFFNENELPPVPTNLVKPNTIDPFLTLLIHIILTHCRTHTRWLENFGVKLHSIYLAFLVILTPLPEWMIFI
jgi:hypothetical protein